MGFFRRFKDLSKPRQFGSGRLWDNTNTPGSKGNPSTTATQAGVTTPPDTTAFMHGPNPEQNLQTAEYKNPFRLQSRYLKLQPEIPVSEPWATSSTYVQNNNTSTAQIKNQVPIGQYVGSIKSLAPPMTTQRDTLYDDVDYARIQKGTFITPSQVYFNQRDPLPEFTTPSTFTHAVIAGNNGYYPVESQPGWMQSFVPGSAGVSPRLGDQLEVGTSPPWLLSTPLNVKQITYSEYDKARAPIKATAPKRKRSA